MKYNHLDVHSAITVNIRSRIRCNNFIFFIPFIKAKLISTNIMYELREMTPLPIQVTLPFLHLTVTTINCHRVSFLCPSNILIPGYGKELKRMLLHHSCFKLIYSMVACLKIGFSIFERKLIF